jgi:hypothetical protein
MVMSVALLTDQRRVEDCPFEIVDGSAVKLLMVGLPTVGGKSLCATGGGGATGGFFFPHADTNTSNISASSMAAVLKRLILWNACD